MATAQQVVTPGRPGRVKHTLSSMQVLPSAKDMRRREQQARSLKLPHWSKAELDAEGVVRGRTWRQMPAQNDFGRACSWWLWKRGVLNIQQEHEEARALADFTQQSASASEEES